MENGSGNNVALIVGVTGMVGLSLVSNLKSANNPEWTVYGLARRFQPIENLDGFIQLDILDRAATSLALSPLSTHVTHLFWVALQERDTDSATSSANTTMLTNVLDALTSQAGSVLKHVALQTGAKHYYWGLLRDQASINQLVPFKESAPRNEGTTLFYYDLEDVLVRYQPRITWTVHRASIVLGGSNRSLYNVLLTLAIYASVCKREGSPFLFPGSPYAWVHLCDVSDADLLAEQQVWAGSEPRAWNQAFNCTNGDVFTWRSFWKVLCDLFQVEFVECRTHGEDMVDWVGEMIGKEGVWDEIVKENGLSQTKLSEVTCFGVVYAILNLGFQHVSCMNKSREFGFSKTVDTLKSVEKWVFKLREMNLIPKV